MAEDNQNIEAAQETEREDTTKTMEKMFKVLSVVIGLALLGFLIILKIRRPDFPLNWTIALMIGTIALFSLTYFGFAIARKFKETLESKTEKIKSISVEQAEQIAIKLVKSPKYSDYIEQGIKGVQVVHMGKSKEPICYIIAEGIYEHPSAYHVLINMNHPYEKNTVLLNPSSPQVTRALTALPSQPEETPDTEEIHETSPLTGVERTVKRTKKLADYQRKPPKKEDDL